VRFPGQYFDGETGLHYNYFRYYDPGLGRYVTSDLVGLATGLNTYGYVAQQPTVSIDLFGLEKTILIVRTTGDPDAYQGLLTWEKEGPFPWKKPGEYAEKEYGECDECRTVNIKASRVDQIMNALKTYNNISKLIIIGHAGSDGVWVSSENAPRTNISERGGKNDVSVNDLDFSNLTKDARIMIWGCNAGRGDNSIAQAFANASNRITVAPNTYVNFDESTGEPYIKHIRVDKLFGEWTVFRPK
jgi:RHS repeat-associated protein